MRSQQATQRTTGWMLRIAMNTLMTRKNQKGVLLLEVLVSILIFAFAFLGLVALQARAIQFSIDAEDRNRAALLANEIVSTMWAQQTTNKDTLAPEITAWKNKVKTSLPPYTDASPIATVSAADGNGVVSISITWTPAGTSSTHTYLTQIAMP